ncbi:formate dehydrogenase accessory sulfurtransferase FdhD [Proteiniborus sp. MB09-C3]|uniref:formate dehydrogenase accessory sulfurtransferase FdhD n=1 Tax=Proteiniborus sp. MB09-C3 TaxID=3050072 RepID=UPI0025526092|nr:formate dehydrogenase accessory sulfurtransferase FdhD [Proteiniborus sp. MB09-C3]WIV12578.1 formate dehydrogenase accessory sulfurtransferase FdhD [Proteiniborus sp. MB09-C3]
MKETKKFDILKVKGEGISEEEDIVVSEYPFTIFINGEEFITLLCSPKSLKYLAVGFLYSEGFISSISDILSIKIEEEKGLSYVELKNRDLLAEKLYGKRTITSGCGKGTLFYNVLDSFKSKKIKNKLPITLDEIKFLVKDFSKSSELFLSTGGVHSCALCNTNDILIFEEDIGRHNALDKVLGKALIDDMTFTDKILLVSGRLSSEMLIKTAKREIPILISRAAPTSLAIELARELNITLIGFARGEKMNIYSNFPSLNF